MVSQLLSNPEQSDADQLDATAADHVISTCGGDARGRSWCRMIGRIGTIKSYDANKPHSLGEGLHAWAFILKTFAMVR